MPENPQQRPFRSLQLKLMLLILISSILFTVATTAIQIKIEQAQELSDLDHRIESLRETHLPSLALSVWSLDSQQIDTQLKSLLSIPDIHAVELKTAYGETFQASHNNKLVNFKTYSMMLTRNEEDMLELGELQIHIDLDDMQQHINDLSLLLLGTEAIKTLLLSLVILFIVQRLITRHLGTIASYTGSIRLNQLDQPLELHRSHQQYRDELDTLVTVFNRMRETFRKDVDLLEEIQHNLRQSEETYRLAMQATQDGLWDWNIEDNDVYYSPSWSKMLQLSVVPNEFSTWHDRLHPDDIEKVMSSLQKHLNGDIDLWQMEHRLKRNDGEWLWVLGRGQVVKRDQNNRPLRMIGTMSDIHQKKQYDEQIWHQANYDPLTNLPNRKFISELLDQEIRKAKRSHSHVWLLFMDLDGFKDVNDTLGHHAGDELLQEVARRIQHTIRSADIAGRLGGDEFALVLSGISEINQIDYFAGRLISAIGKPYQLQHGEALVTASLGIASYPQDADNTRDLIRFADQAMYVSKKEGKNRYSYFTPALQSAAEVRRQISSDILEAIRQNHFELYFQPILQAHPNSMIKGEVLLRWNHPEKGMISPAAFIPLAEETGVITAIGNWVFDRALTQLREWKQQYHCDNFKLSINLSPIHLQNKDEGFTDWLDQITANGLKGDDIILEITEGVLLKNDRLIKQRLDEFRSRGIQFAIDDFGTGYSSLSYLNELDVDYLKIDQSFIRKLSKHSSEETLVQAIIVMAHRLGLQVIAEGVETAEQENLLRQMNCDYLQGFLFSKPVPATQFAEKYLSNL